jgi:DNA-directed RNA polymerase subunit RPC12/RpoP
MKQYDIEYSGSGRWVRVTGMDHPTVHCHTCNSTILLDKDKYFISRKLSFSEQMKQLLGSKVETRYLCQQCHRQEQLEKII